MLGVELPCGLHDWVSEHYDNITFYVIREFFIFSKSFIP